MSNLVIILGGPGGSGRSTTAAQISTALGLERVQGGEMHRQKAVELGFKKGEAGLVEYFSDYVPSHPEVDLEIDAQLFRRATEGRVVIESWTLAPLSKRLGLNYLRIWITADETERVHRIQQRQEKIGQKQSLSELKLLVRQRIEQNRQRYKKIYSFDFLDTAKYYSHVFDTTQLDEAAMGTNLIKNLELRRLL